MDTMVVEQEAPEVDEDVLEVPGPEVFSACTQCGHRSAMYFLFKGDFLPFCGHHGEKNFEKLTDLEAPLIADYRANLVKNVR